MSDYSGYVRRQELVCTLDELSKYSTTVLLENETLWVNKGDGNYALKIGDGINTVGDLPYIVDYDDIKNAEENAKASETICVNAATSLSPLTVSPSSYFTTEGLLEDY